MNKIRPNSKTSARHMQIKFFCHYSVRQTLFKKRRLKARAALHALGTEQLCTQSHPKLMSIINKCGPLEQEAVDWIIIRYDKSSNYIDDPIGRKD